MDSDQISHVSKTDIFFDRMTKYMRKYTKRIAEGESLSQVAQDAMTDSEVKRIECEAHRAVHAVIVGQQHETSVLFRPIDIEGTPKLHAVK